MSKDTMTQATMTSPGVIRFDEVTIPKLGADQVLIRIKRIGICGSDIHVWHGRHPYTKYPVVQGHEVSGEITEIGTDVRGLKVGDRVTIRPQVVCGECYPCRTGRYHICDDLKVMGFQTTGTASEYFAVDASKALKLPDAMDFNFGAMVEPVAVAIHAIGRFGSVDGKKVLVMGAGPIGNLVAQTAKALGASKTMITDISDFRLALADGCGVDSCVNTAKTDFMESLTESFGPDRADVIFECVGVNDTIDKAVAGARKGTDIIVVGVFGEKPKVDLGIVQDRELRLIGTLMYKEEDFTKAIELIDGGSVNLEPLITDHFAFEDYSEAYRFIEDRGDKTMKVILDVG